MKKYKEVKKMFKKNKSKSNTENFLQSLQNAEKKAMKKKKRELKLKEVKKKLKKKVKAVGQAAIKHVVSASKKFVERERQKSKEFKEEYGLLPNKTQKRSKRKPKYGFGF